MGFENEAARAAAVIRDSAAFRTPFYLLDETRLKQNLEILREVQAQSGARILLAQKAFSAFALYPLLRTVLAGTAASGLYEARLGHEEFGGETHVFSPAYRADEMEELLQAADHVIFNTPAQARRFAGQVRAAGRQAGLRLNPECSTQEGPAIYDPCAPGSRLGTTAVALEAEKDFETELLPLLSGFHMHTLCEQNSDALEITFRAAEKAFGRYFSRVKWLNLGGGITSRGTDTTGSA